MTPVPRRRFAAPKGARNAFIDLLLEHWPRIASVAWDAFPPAAGEVTVH